MSATFSNGSSHHLIHSQTRIRETSQVVKSSPFYLNPKLYKNKLRKSNNPKLTLCLLDYVKSGQIINALSLFDRTPHLDPYLWNVMIRGFTDNGLFRDCIDFYHRMEFEGVQADYFTFPFVIKCAGELLLFTEGEKIHAKLLKIGLDSDIYICNSLVLMYAKLGFINLAEKVFDEMPERDLVSWNSMISGYLFIKDGKSSLACFREMKDLYIRPDRFSIINVLNGCSMLRYLQNGKEIHCQVLRNFFDKDVMIQTSLIDMYNKCAEIDYSEKLLNLIPERSVVVWNAIIGGFSSNGRPSNAFSALKMMQEDGKINLDAVTMINLLPSCKQIGAFLEGKSIHGYSIRNGFLPHVVLETALLDMYLEFGVCELGKSIFTRMIRINLVSLNAMISGCVQNGLYMEALGFFQDLLQRFYLKPDSITFSAILPAFTELGFLREGKQIHGQITKLGFHSNTFISNSAIYMYATCGDLDTAREIFDRMLIKDVISWNTIIRAYGIHGFGSISLKLFLEMNENGIKPNYSTFVSLLSSCSISGMNNEGWRFFNSMKTDYGINPGIEHYGCMIDLLGRSGDLDQAKSLIEEMPMDPTARIWGALLNASRNNGNLELAELAAKHVLSSKHDNTGCYVLLANIYKEAGKEEDVERIRSIMNDKGLKKTVGFSLVEINSKSYKFYNQDRSHFESNMIYDILDVLSRQIGESRYVHSLTKFRVEDLKKGRANSPENHSVRLAICYGLISIKVGRPVTVRKNMRICNDCHDFGKKVSKITNREIVVGDCKVFHHFKCGQCSCRDYW